MFLDENSRGEHVWGKRFRVNMDKILKFLVFECLLCI